MPQVCAKPAVMQAAAGPSPRCIAGSRSSARGRSSAHLGPRALHQPRRPDVASFRGSDLSSSGHLSVRDDHTRYVRAAAGGAGGGSKRQALSSVSKSLISVLKDELKYELVSGLGEAIARCMIADLMQAYYIPWIGPMCAQRGRAGEESRNCDLEEPCVIP